jgi:hypothetical protein
VQIPKQGERRDRELQDLVKKGKRPVALFIDEAHDLNGHTLIGLKRLMEVVEDVGGRLPKPASNASTAGFKREPLQLRLLTKPFNILPTDERACKRKESLLGV